MICALFLPAWRKGHLAIALNLYYSSPDVYWRRPRWMQKDSLVDFLTLANFLLVSVVANLPQTKNLIKTLKIKIVLIKGILDLWNGINRLEIFWKCFKGFLTSKRDCKGKPGYHKVVYRKSINQHLGFKWVTKHWSNNIIHSSAYQFKALELANLKIISFCQTAHQGCAGNSRQLHPLKIKYWMRN